MTSLTKYEIGFGKEIKGKKSQWGLIKTLDLKYHTIIDNEKEKSLVSDKVWFKINKDWKGNEAEKWWVLIQNLDFVYVHMIRQWAKKSWFLDVAWIWNYIEISGNEAEKDGFLYKIWIL